MAAKKKTTEVRKRVPGFSPDDDLLSQLIWEIASQSNAAVKKRLKNKSDLTSLIPVVLAALALMEFIRRPQAPKWNELMWYSYSMFRDLNVEKRKVPHFHQESEEEETEKILD